jgi:hypothetical protein
MENGSENSLGYEEELDLFVLALNINLAYESRLNGSIRLSFDLISQSSQCYLQQIYLFPIQVTIRAGTPIFKHDHPVKQKRYQARYLITRK